MNHARLPVGRRAVASAALAAIVIVATAAAAGALWGGGTAGGSRARSQTVGAGNAPLVNAAGASVTVSWSASSLQPSGVPATGYLVKRYSAADVLQAIGTGCNTTIAGLSCIEANVPNGTWKYSVTPAVGNWRGAESSRTSVTVASPVVTLLTPSSRPQGYTGNLTVTGSNFLAGAVASFSGTGITVNSTTFVNATMLTVNITINGAATTGARNVTVTNTDTGTGTCTGCFTVAPAPTVTSTSPPFGYRSTTQNISVLGTGFVSGAVASFSGTGITVNSTTFVNSTTLTANITISAAATQSARNVTVTNPDTGTGTCTGCFTVPVGPTVTSVTPNSRGQGATSQVLTVQGNFFLNGAAVTFSGGNISVNSTTFVSSTQLSVNVTVATGATISNRNVTVTNPAGGGTAGTCTACFAVTARPGNFSLSPNSRAQGAINQNITITGSLFQNGAVATFSGTGITVNSTTFVSATQLTVNVSIDPAATTGNRNVTVTNPDAGTRTVNNAFSVAAGPKPTSVSVSPRPRGFTGNVTVTGTGFATGAVTSFSGTGITVNSTTYVNATTLTVNISISAVAATGTRDVTVTIPSNGGVGTGPAIFSVT